MNRRWPLEPLLAVTKLSPHGLRQRANVKHEAYARAELEGLTDRQSDRWSVRCGFHPSQVWGPAWDEAGLSVLDREFVENGWRPAWLWNDTEPVELGEAA